MDYPAPPRSYLLRNVGGRFVDVTERVAPDLARPAEMISDAVWVDLDGDGRLDLVTAGEWTPIRVRLDRGGRLEDATARTGLPPMRGWWYRLAVGDLNRDGRPDLVAGNLGLDYSFTTSDTSRFGLYALTLGAAGTRDLLFTQGIHGHDYPVYGLATLGASSDLLRLRYSTVGAFADVPIDRILGADLRRGALHYEADTFASVWLRNDGGGRFTALELPRAAQISPLQGLLVEDVDRDGSPDVIAAGNLLDTEPNTAPADAGKGLWLRGDGRGHFQPVPPATSGFLAPRDARGLALVHTRAGRLLLVANAGDSLQVFRLPR